MSKTKQYIEEQLEKGIDVLHPEWLNLQNEESYGKYGMVQNEKGKKTKSNKQIRETEGLSGICSDLPF
jgi:hypothetical protein